ncbi:ANTAR domain-containing protein [Mycetocola manganoxydans]|uniref:ANTAR domain-containing protein n=1 Tax=Mycetocola manganoxydans TaxID=699879 RepID=A0A3L6ZZD8_9MICO|nr:GAF and ANTAR domain-containing protein [Mycetocola manganoxydans]RLP73406.1 ANTAR domain-containing protein [Mycetocola manganoxydans]GHD41871.1 transcriptional regulator [Mycetocola manganoxydans]
MTTETTREGQLVDAFATLADTLVADYDAVELLQTLVENCRDILDISAAGILLADLDGELDVVASTSEASRLVEVMQLGAQAGPCIECFSTGDPVSLPDIREAPDKWARFRDGAAAQGFKSVYALPLRLRETTIGALNLLRTEAGELNERDVRAAQALADVATIGILHARSLRESDAVRDQLQRALNSRVVIEQAKGVLSQTQNVTTDDAFGMMRQYARNHGMLLSNVAEQLVRRTLTISN